MAWLFPTSLAKTFTKPVKHPLSDAPDDEPIRKRWKHVDSTDISPDQQLVPLINRQETAAELLEARRQSAALHYGVNSDNDDDEFADAEEDLATGALDDLEASLVLQQHANSEPLPIVQSIAMEEAAEHEEPIDFNKPYDVLHDDFDQAAIPDEQFRSDGYHAEYIVDDQQQLYDPTSETEEGTFGVGEADSGSTAMPLSSHRDEQVSEQQFSEDHDKEQWPAETFSKHELQTALGQQESCVAPEYDYGDIGIESSSRQQEEPQNQLVQEEPVAQEQPDHDYAFHEQLQQLGIVNTGEQELDTTTTIIISDEENEEDDDEEDDLFASAFGKVATIQEDGDDADSDSDPEIIQVALPTKPITPKQQRSTFPPPQDQTTALQDRIPTPPLPGSQSTTGINKTNKPIPKITLPKPPKPERPPHPYGSLVWDGRIRPGPDIDRDMSKTLRDHWRFHERILAQVSKLKNFEAYDLDRRYLIGVLPIHGKTPKAISSEKDLFWMYGNKFSTVRTVWEKYWERAFDADKEEYVMLMGHEVVDMEDQMQQLDYFNDKLCVFRFVEKRSETAKGKKFDEGYPIYHYEPEVVVIDDD